MQPYLKLTAFISLFCFFTTLNAQKQVDWDVPPPREELKLMTWETDTLADAVVLNHQGTIYCRELNKYLGFQFSEKKRIKILKKSAFDRANVRLPFYHKDDYEYIYAVKARTWLPNGQKIEVEPKTIVTEKLNERWSVKKITFPQVTEGAILEYEYDLESVNLRELREWYFQEDIPVRQSVLNLDIWSRYEYAFLTQGSDNIVSSKPEYSSDKRTNMTFTALNQAGLREEKYISTMDDYRTRIRFQLAKYYDLQGNKHEIMSDWERTARDLNDEDYFGKKFSRKSSYDDVWKLLEPIFTEGDTGMVKIQKIYDFVNGKIKQDGLTGRFSLQSGNDCLKKGKGSATDINLLLVGLIREAGFEAFPVLVGTRSHGKPFENYPLLDQFNLVLAAVELPDGRSTLLDGGKLTRPMGILRLDALNGRGCLIRKKNAQWMDIKPPLSSEMMAANYVFDKEGNLKGEVMSQSKGYAAVNERDNYFEQENGDFIKKKWQKDLPDMVIDSVKFENAENLKESFRMRFACSMPNALDMTTDLVYFKPFLQSGWEINPFKNPERRFPVDLSYPRQDQFVLNLNLPNGYKVEEVPKASNLALPNGGGSFQYQVQTLDGNRLQINMRLKIQKTFFYAEEYPSLKKFFDSVAEKLQEMVVLKKGS